MCPVCNMAGTGDACVEDSSGTNWIECTGPSHEEGRAWLHKTCAMIVTPADAVKYTGENAVFVDCPLCQSFQARTAPAVRSNSTAPQPRGRGGTSAESKKCSPRCPGCRRGLGCEPGMGLLTGQQRRLLGEALVERHRQWLLANAEPPKRGEPLMVANQAGHGGFKAKLLYWGHNRVGYVRVLDAEQIAAGVQPDKGRVSHNQVQRISVFPYQAKTSRQMNCLTSP